ncbi:MAG: hypothetical protein ACWA5Q_04390 [bacterium]
MLFKQTCQSALLFAATGLAGVHALEPLPTPENTESIEALSHYYTSAAVTIITDSAGKGDGISDVVCRAFKAGIKSPHSQATSAQYAIRGATDPSQTSSIGKGPSIQAVVRGIETCLDYKLDYEVAMVIVEYIGDQGFDFPPDFTAYKPPSPTHGDPFGNPDINFVPCVSNCI